MATLDFLRKLIVNTPASCDQDHLPFLAFSVPQIPDRTEAILAGSNAPLRAMTQVIRRLERAGATHVVIPCNTAHFWFEELSATISIPILHIVDAVAEDMRRQNRQDGPVGLLATSGTLRGRIYQNRLKRHQIECRVPDRQDEVMEAIRFAKAGQLLQAGRIFAQEASRLFASGCSTIILGCTEIPVALAEVGSCPDNCVDPTAALARKCIRYSSNSAPWGSATAAS